MAESHHPQGTPRRPATEYEDPHFHDDDEVAQPPAEDGLRSPAIRPPGQSPRKLPPPKRRFHEE